MQGSQGPARGKEAQLEKDRNEQILSLRGTMENNNLILENDLQNDRNVGKQSLLCVHGSQPWILAPPFPTRAKKCPGESLPTFLQNRVQFAVQQCLRQFIGLCMFMVLDQISFSFLA